MYRPTLTNYTCDPNATSLTSKVQFVELFAGAGSLSMAAEARGGEIAVLTQSEPIACKNMRHRFPDAN